MKTTKLTSPAPTPGGEESAKGGIPFVGSDVLGVSVHLPSVFVRQNEFWFDFGWKEVGLAHGVEELKKLICLLQESARPWVDTTKFIPFLGNQWLESMYFLLMLVCPGVSSLMD